LKNLHRVYHPKHPPAFVEKRLRRRSI